MPVPTEKSTFDNACPKTLWYMSISPLTVYSSFIIVLNMLLKTCWPSAAGTKLPSIVDLAGPGR